MASTRGSFSVLVTLHFDLLTRLKVLLHVATIVLQRAYRVISPTFASNWPFFRGENVKKCDLFFLLLPPLQGSRQKVVTFSPVYVEMKF